MMKKLVFHDPAADDFFYNESIRTLRANIQFSGRKNKVIMFTSAFQDEGKSDVTYHCAVSMAELGRRVLLIDTDIRNSRYIQTYGIEEKVTGLSEYLSGQADNPDDILYSTQHEGLDVIFAGAYAPNPTELLGDDLFSRLLEDMRRQYDYIFVDTPPLGAVIDAAMTGQHCDGAILVIESGAVSYHVAQKVQNQLEMSGVKIMGVVLNKADTAAGNRYGKYGKYGRYGKYGKYGRYGGKYGYGYGYGGDDEKQK